MDIARYAAEYGAESEEADRGCKHPTRSETISHPATDRNENREAQCVAGQHDFMLSGATSRASDTAGTAVFRIVVSSDSMKNATATSHGKSCLLEAGGGREEALIRCVPKLVVCLFLQSCRYL
jgi:hypothetical protein